MYMSLTAQCMHDVDSVIAFACKRLREAVNKSSTYLSRYNRAKMQSAADSQHDPMQCDSTRVPDILATHSSEPYMVI